MNQKKLKAMIIETTTEISMKKPVGSTTSELSSFGSHCSILVFEMRHA